MFTNVIISCSFRFCTVPSPQTTLVLAKILMECLSHYSLENKISSVVLDDATTDDAMMSILMENLEPNLLMLGGGFLHLRCSAHIINLVVNDGLAAIAPTIGRIRDCIEFWMSTSKRIEKFGEACQLLNISSSRRLVIDCKNRWDSTYLMLQTALPYKDVFRNLKHMHMKLKFVIPSEHDWLLASLVVEKLDIFYKATKVFSGRNHPTSNLFFRKVCEIKLALRRWVQSDVEAIRVMIQNMVEKFDEYWEQISGILAVATILDPRNKLDCVDYYFKRLYGDEAEQEVEKVRLSLDTLVAEYQRIDLRNNSQEPLSKWKDGVYENCDGEEDEYAQAKRIKKRKVHLRSEVEHYLDDDPIPEVDNFDILDWWKKDQTYPTLQKIAKDILAIPVSSVASENAFSSGGRVVRSRRSKLHSETVEALMCLRNWMVDDTKGNN